MKAKPTFEALAQLIAQGNSDAQCGRHFEVSKYTIRRLRRRWNIPAGRMPSKPPRTVDLSANRWGKGDLDDVHRVSLYGLRCYGPPAYARSERDGRLRAAKRLHPGPMRRLAEAGRTMFA